jgi:outer membrane protein OmpA-like peptidoglycan-associated protein
MRAILFLFVVGQVAASVAAPPAQAQLLKRVTERVKQKVEERKLQTEESAISRAAEPADSALARMTAPVESLATRVGGGAAAAVGGLGRGTDATAEAMRLRDELAAGRAELPAIRFQAGTPALDPSCETALRSLAMALTQLPGVFLVQGRADAGASEAEALPLGAARAAAIKAWLVDNGIGPDRVFATSDGTAAPDAPLATVTSMH